MHSQTELASVDAKPGQGQPRFLRRSPGETGLQFENLFDWQHPRKHLYPHGYAGGGVTVGDYDGDGRPDLFFTSQTGRDRLFRQVERLKFEDVTDAAGLAQESDWGTGASFVDIEGDGDLDLFVANYDAPNRLYVNLGNGRFEERAEAMGLAFRGASIMAAFADHDGDGDLDMYLVTNRLYPPPELDQPKLEFPGGKANLAPGQEESFILQERIIDGEAQKFVANVGQRDRLYENLGDGRFRETSKAAGISGNHPGLSATFWDADGDGDADLYVCNDFWEPDRFYRNEGDGRFVDIVEQAVPHTPWFSMGSDFADINGDGHMDFLAADMSATTHFMSKIMMGNMNDSRWFLISAQPRQYMRNALYLGTATPHFMEVGWMAGLASTDWTWSVKFGDLDNDGRSDLFATNGTANHSFDPDLAKELETIKAELAAKNSAPEKIWAAQWEAYRSRPPRKERNLAKRNLGDLKFESVGAQWGLDHEGISFGAVLSDLDRDGDLDVVVSNVGEPASLFENRSSEGGRILVQLEGQGANTRAIGARLRLRQGEQWQTRQVFTTRGYMSANEALVHFGLGAAQSADELEITWPSGRRQTIAGVAGGMLHTVREREADTRPSSGVPAPQPLLRDVDGASGLAVGFRPEAEFDDYERQPLLPAKMSHMGPAIAVADVDGDGDEDLFIGGSRDRPGRMFLADGKGQFAPLAGEAPWVGDAAAEDAGVAFLDVDGDGDQDLYVASGGPEHGPNHALLRDRLYLNSGDGKFVAAPKRWLPNLRDGSGAVAVADFDGDGRLDVFVAGRQVPGAYPTAPRSRLLRNTGRRLVDVTAKVAPKLASVGMITAAQWSDLDGDGDLDLALALDWGPIRVFINERGRLQDRSDALGLSSELGWWTSLRSADIDEDGDFDLIALNAGLNTKYKASAKKPQRLYYGDFEGDGRKHVVEAKGGSKAELPVRGLSCSSAAMPFIAEAMDGSYRNFAGASLEQIYPEDKLARALKLEANQLSHGIWRSQLAESGELKFVFEPLPRMSQVAPGYGCIVDDLDGDGRLDLMFGQNFYEREPETGRWDGGLGATLLGAKGKLEWLANGASGFVVPGDASAMVRVHAGPGTAASWVVGRNDRAPASFLRAREFQRRTLQLVGPKGNPTGIGARVEAVYASGRRVVREVSAGAGYLSQSSPRLEFVDTEGDRIALYSVRWPDGSKTEMVAEAKPSGGSEWLRVRHAKAAGPEK